MDRVDLGVVISQPVNECRPTQPLQMFLVRQLPEHLRRVGADVLRQAEQVGLGYRNQADLPRPRIDFAEYPPMERAKVREIVMPRDCLQAQAHQGGPGNCRLNTTQPLVVGDVELVKQNVGERVAIWVDHSLTPYSAPTCLSISSAVISPWTHRSMMMSMSRGGVKPSTRRDASACVTALRRRSINSL